MPTVTGSSASVIWMDGNTLNSATCKIPATTTGFSNVGISRAVSGVNKNYLFTWGYTSYGGELDMVTGNFTDKYFDAVLGQTSASRATWNGTNHTGTAPIGSSIAYSGATTLCRAMNGAATISYMGAIGNPGSIDEICAFPLNDTTMQFYFPTSSGITNITTFRNLYLLQVEPRFLFERASYIEYPGSGTTIDFATGTNVFTTGDSARVMTFDYSYAGLETPKKDWRVHDRYNYYDYNRLKANVDAVDVLAGAKFPSLVFDSTGSPMPSYETGNFARYPFAGFNAFENNLDKVATALSMDIGVKKSFYSEAVFIDWQELNRLETATETLYNVLIAM